MSEHRTTEDDYPDGQPTGTAEHAEHAEPRAGLDAELVDAELVDAELVDAESVAVLWSTSYYDGPVAGVAHHAGRDVWFCLLDEDDDGARTFGLWELTDDELAEVFSQWALFRRHIGTHTDTLGPSNDVADRAGWHRFYDRPDRFDARTVQERVPYARWAP